MREGQPAFAMLTVLGETGLRGGSPVNESCVFGFRLKGARFDGARWQSVVGALWQWKEAAFSLRSLVGSALEEPEPALIVRLSGSLSTRPRQAAADLMALCERAAVSLDPILDRTCLERFLRPFPKGSIVELRQPEISAHMSYYDASFLLVLPFSSLRSRWREPLAVARRLRSPSMISVHLQPTQLYDCELEALARKAAICQQFARGRIEGSYYHNGRAPMEPDAVRIERFLENSLRELRWPFLLVVQVTSSDRETADAIAEELRHEIMTDSASVPMSVLAGGAQAAASANVDSPDYKAASNTLSALRLESWGPTIAPVGQERLRFLAGAAAAASAFQPAASSSALNQERAAEQATYSFKGNTVFVQQPTGAVLLSHFQDAQAASGPVSVCTGELAASNPGHPEHGKNEERGHMKIKSSGNTVIVGESQSVHLQNF